MTQEPRPLPGFMPGRVPDDARPPESFDPLSLAKHLLRVIRAGTLATLDRSGYPFASLVNTATDIDGSPVILVSRLTTHTANLERDPRASILLAERGKGDPLAHPRLTVLGRFERRDDDPRLARRFLARHVKSELYSDFADFSFWRMTVVSAHLNGGFARAADLTGEELLTSLAGGDELVAVEASAVEHMNEDHADAVLLYATKLLGGTTGAWRVTSVDPEGIDLALGDSTLRLAFPHRVTDRMGLITVLKQFADTARAMN